MGVDRMIKKKKVRKYTFESYSQIFDEFSREEESRTINKKLYDKIYDYYDERLRIGSLDIKNERITIERKLGKYKGFGTSLNAQLLIVPFASMLAILIQLASDNVPAKYSTIISFLVLVCAFMYMLRDIERDKVTEKEVVFNICLIVLDDLEDENDLSNGNLAKHEAATTVQEEQLKEQVKHISNQNNGNWNITISETTILAMAKGIYRTSKFVGRLFKKKKK
jgi:hypothetical protein